MPPSSELMSLRIRLSMESLLHAHAQANMYRSNRHPGYLEGMSETLDKASELIAEVKAEAQRIAGV